MSAAATLRVEMFANCGAANPSGRGSLPQGLRRQLVAVDGHFEVGADGLSFANAFSHPHEQLRNVEGRPHRYREWNPAIALRIERSASGLPLCAPRTVNSDTCTLISRRGVRIPSALATRHCEPPAVTPHTTMFAVATNLFQCDEKLDF